MNAPKVRKEPGADTGNESETNTRELLNEVTEWLQYACGMTDLMAELVYEAETLDCRRMALAFQTIGALLERSVTCTKRAHERVVWEQAQQWVETSATH
ncbi:hypothetical protein [Luteibacter sp.]|jgi:hypothetical protein|uniref:hypothetical protein n=1 Tax=Luteibacter sp. TaxID=1886636 RepID=UPI002F41AA46